MTKLFIRNLTICALLLCVLAWFAKPKVSTHALQPTTKEYFQLTHIYNKNEVWKVASTFEPVDGSLSLYVAQAHRPVEHNSINRLVFLDIHGCLGGELQRIARVGDDIGVMLLETRLNGMSSTVTNGPVSVMAFVKPPCQ